VIKDGHPPLTAQVKPRQTPAAKPITEAENQAADAESMANLSQDKKQISDSLLVAPAPVAVAPGRNNLSKARTEEYNSNSVPGNKSTVANKMPALNNRFSVTVTGADNSPLPFANVLVVDDNIGTYADAKGKFKLVAADSILTVRVKAAGYVPQEYTIKSGLADNRIVLAEQQVATNEMVRLKNKKAAGAVPKITVQLDSLTNVEPEDGWYNYDTYLSNNLSPVIDKNIHGEVEVIFDVQKDGSLSNVSIAKSLCAACDQEALRVIKEGPQWKVKKGKKDKGKVKVKF
jgi:TonB family protein